MNIRLGCNIYSMSWSKMRVHGDYYLANQNYWALYKRYCDKRGFDSVNLIKTPTKKQLE